MAEVCEQCDAEQNSAESISTRFGQIRSNEIRVNVLTERIINSTCKSHTKKIFQVFADISFSRFNF